MTVDNYIHVIGGSAVVLSVLLGMYVDQRFLWFTIFVGLNLAQSGITGWCPMMSILRMCHVPEQRPTTSPRA
ncbi:MAG: DUF2892 domain-containing protein [Vicinamibacterales bacterium]